MMLIFYIGVLDTLRYSNTEKHPGFRVELERSEGCIEKIIIGLLDTLRYSKTAPIPVFE